VGYLLDFLAIQGYKIAGMAEDCPHNLGSPLSHKDPILKEIMKKIFFAT